MYYFFYFPLGTEGRLSRLPVATITLAGILLVTHYLLHYFAPTVDLFWSLVLPTDRPTVVQAFTACFVHADLFHLIGNLLYLITFGPALESRVSRLVFVGFYLLAGFASMLVQVEAFGLLHPGEPPIVVLGASGAISGLLGLFAARAWFLRVRVAHLTMAYLQGMAKGGVTAIPAWIAIAAWTVLQGAYSIVSLESAASGTAYWAHLSGLVVGFATGLGGGLFQEGMRERMLIRGQRYMEKGAWFAALGEFESYNLSTGGRPESKLGVARAQRVLRRSREALAAYNGAFQMLVEAERYSEAAGVIQEMQRMSGTAMPEARRVFRVASWLEENDDALRAVSLFERLGELEASDRLASAAWERAAEICRLRLGDLERAARLFARASERLGEEPALKAHRQRQRRLKGRARECNRVYENRIKFAVARPV